MSGSGDLRQTFTNACFCFPSHAKSGYMLGFHMSKKEIPK